MACGRGQALQGARLPSDDDVRDYTVWTVEKTVQTV
jgi:hypothetical protein